MRPKPPKPAPLEDEAHHQKRREVIEAGIDREGNPLSDDNADKYTPAQKKVFDKALELNADLMEKFKAAKNMDERRVLVNAYVPKDVSYATRLTPASVKCVTERVFTQK